MHTAPGLKIVCCVKRLPQLTHAEFSRHWREIHAPLVEKHRSVLRIARYVQAHSDLGTLSDQLRAFRGSPEPYDGVAEMVREPTGIGDARRRSCCTRRESGVARGRAFC